MVASAETVNMLTYSPRKNIANFSELYSVWNPPVSSPSPSARSNGQPVGLADHGDDVDQRRRRRPAG